MVYDLVRDPRRYVPRTYGGPRRNAAMEQYLMAENPRGASVYPGITGNYNYALYPYPAPNARLNAWAANGVGNGFGGRTQFGSRPPVFRFGLVVGERRLQKYTRCKEKCKKKKSIDRKKCNDECEEKYGKKRPVKRVKRSVKRSKKRTKRKQRT